MRVSSVLWKYSRAETSLPLRAGLGGLSPISRPLGATRNRPLSNSACNATWRSRNDSDSEKSCSARGGTAAATAMSAECAICSLPSTFSAMTPASAAASLDNSDRFSASNNASAQKAMAPAATTNNADTVSAIRAFRLTSFQRFICNSSGRAGGRPIAMIPVNRHWCGGPDAMLRDAVHVSSQVTRPRHFSSSSDGDWPKAAGHGDPSGRQRDQESRVCNDLANNRTAL